MERLTERLNNGAAYVVSETGTEGVGHYTTQRRLPEVITRLAAYEDTGLTPEQIATMARAAAIVKSAMGERTLEWLMEKLQEGRVRVIPAEPGDLYRNKRGEVVEVTAIHVTTAARQVVVYEGAAGLNACDELYFRRNFTKEEATP